MEDMIDRDFFHVQPMTDSGVEAWKQLITHYHKQIGDIDTDHINGSILDENSTDWDKILYFLLNNNQDKRIYALFINIKRCMVTC